MPQDRYPVNGTFELTVRCNLKCKMCLVRHDDSENSYLRSHELNASEWIDMARQAAEAGTFTLLITGGEPMLRSDFCEIWEGIYKQGFLLELYTNATLVSPKIMDTLRKYPPHRIGITVYGTSRETYDKVCGSARAFDQMLAGVKSLLELPSKFNFRSTIIKDNFDEVMAIQDLVTKEFGDYTVTNSRLITQSVRGACADVNTCRLEPEDNLKVVYARAYQKAKEIMGDSFRPEDIKITSVKAYEDSENESRVSFFGCDAGMNQYTISWDGKLLGCQLMGAFVTDALKEGLQKAWNQYPAVVKQKNPGLPCSECGIADECESCAATRYAETGSTTGFSEYICRFTKLNHKFLNN